MLVPGREGLAPINATQVEIHGGIAYANDGTVIRAYSLETGDLFQTISVGSEVVTGLSIEGDHLYAMDAGNHLTAFDLSGPSMVKQGTFTTPVGGGQLTVGNGVAYIAGESGAVGGFATVDVSNPNTLTLISGVDANNLAGHAIALNGSGLAVTVGSPGNLGNLVHLVNVNDPTNTGNLVTQFTLPADPHGVTIANGLAFIADGTNGLVVVNYLSADTAGVAPTATLSSTAADRDPVAPGLQVQAGSLIPIKLTVADDAQVASVELLKDGVVIGTDTSFPFEFGAIPAGLIVGGQTKLQIRATDTGGTTGLSETLTFDILADTNAPTLTGSNPNEGGTRSGGLQTVRLFFNEALAQTDLTSDRFTLTGPGSAFVPVKTVTVSQQGRQVSITFDPLLAGAYTLSLDAANLHDLSGNALGTTPLDRHFNVVNATKTFINADGGDWNSPANWENGTLPTASDIVALPLNPGKSVTISSGAIKVQGILTDDTLQVTGGSLTLTGASDIAGILKVSNGADLIVDGINASLTVQNPLLDGGDLISRNGGDFHLPTLQVFNSGTITFDGPGEDFDAPRLTNIDNSRIFLSGGAQLTLAATSYRADGLSNNDNVTLFSVDGPGTVLNLAQVQSFNDGYFRPDGGVSHALSASNGGAIDLSGLQLLTLALETDDRLDFKAQVNGQIKLGSLATLTGAGFARFSIEGAGFTLPALVNAHHTQFDLPAYATYQLPALQTLDGGRLALGVGTTLNAPDLLSAVGISITLGTGAVINAPKLKEFTSSDLTLGASQTFNAPAFTKIDNSRIFLSGGVQLTVAATSYRADGLSNNDNVTLFSVDGPGTTLNLAQVQSFNDGYFRPDGGVSHALSASNGGAIDLSGLQLLTLALEPDDRLDFKAQVNGQIKLPSLATLTGAGFARFAIEGTGFTLPALVNAQHTQFDLPANATYQLPALQSLDGGRLALGVGSTLNAPEMLRANAISVTIGSGAVLNAPKFKEFTTSDLTLGASQTFNAPAFTTIDNSRIFLSGGAQLTVAATSYRADGLSNNDNVTLFSVDGPGTVLNLAQVQSFNDGYFRPDGGVSHALSASNGGEIDLSGLQLLTLALETDDRLDFKAQVNGQIKLGSLATLTGAGFARFAIEGTGFTLPALVNAHHTQFDLPASATYQLPALKSLDGGRLALGGGSTLNVPELLRADAISVTLGTGATINAPKFKEFTTSDLTLGASQTFNAPAFATIDNSRIFLSGGAQLTVAATSYRADGLSNNDNVTLFSVDGPGTALNLAQVQSFNDGYFRPDGGVSHALSASNGGVIDLSGLQLLTLALEADDRLRFVQDNGGQLKLQSLSFITGAGYAQFDVTASTMTVGNLPSGKSDVAVHAGGLLHVLGDFTMGASRSVTVDITGAALSQFGRIEVDGIAAIVGTLNIVRPTNFIPSVSDTFAILTYGSHSGTFGTVTGTTAGPRTLTPAYSATALTLNVT